MTNRSIVPYRNSAIGGRPATSGDFVITRSKGQQPTGDYSNMNQSTTNKNNLPAKYQHNNYYPNYQQQHQSGRVNNGNKVYQSANWKQQSTSSTGTVGGGPNNNNNNRFDSPINHHQQSDPFLMQAGHMQGNHSGVQGATIAGFPAEMFQPKTTTFIRKLDPSEVFGDGSEMADFDFGGLVLDSNNVIIQPPIQHHQQNMAKSNNNPNNNNNGGGSPCKAIVPFKADMNNSDEKCQLATKSYHNQAGNGGKRSVVKLISPDQAEDDFHFSPEDFENGQTTYFPASALIQQFGPMKSSPFSTNKQQQEMISGNFMQPHISSMNHHYQGHVVPQQQHQQSNQSFASGNAMLYANRMRSQSLDRKFSNPSRRQSMTHGCASPEQYPNSNNFGYSNIHYEINNTGKVLESSHSCGDALDEEEGDNRKTYGFAEFQAARQRFENNCKQNNNHLQQHQSYPNANSNGQKKLFQHGYRGSIANGYGNSITPFDDNTSGIPLTNRSNFCPQQTACNHGVVVGGQVSGMPGTITTHSKDLDDVNAIQQYVVAEEGGPGGKTKIFSFPAGEAPGDMTLLRAAVAANQPEDPYILEEFQDDCQDDNPMQRGTNQLQMMHTQQSFSGHNVNNNTALMPYGHNMSHLQPTDPYGSNNTKKIPMGNPNRHRNSIAIGQSTYCMNNTSVPSVNGHSYNNVQNSNMIPMQAPFPNIHQMVMPTSSSASASLAGGFGCKSMSPMSNSNNNPGMFNQGSGSVGNNSVYQQQANNNPYYNQAHDCGPYNNNGDIRGLQGFGSPSYLTQSKNLI